MVSSPYWSHLLICWLSVDYIGEPTLYTFLLTRTKRTLLSFSGCWGNWAARHPLNPHSTSPAREIAKRFIMHNANWMWKYQPRHGSQGLANLFLNVEYLLTNVMPNSLSFILVVMQTRSLCVRHPSSHLAIPFPFVGGSTIIVSDDPLRYGPKPQFSGNHHNSKISTAQISVSDNSPRPNYTTMAHRPCSHERNDLFMSCSQLTRE